MTDQEMLEAMRQIIRETVKEENRPLNEKMSEMETKFSKMETRFSNMETRFSNLENEVSELKEYERGTRVLIESKIEFQIRAVAEQHGELVREIKEIGQNKEEIGEVKDRVFVLENVSKNIIGRLETLEAKAQ